MTTASDSTIPVAQPNSLSCVGQWFAHVVFAAKQEIGADMMRFRLLEELFEMPFRLAPLPSAIALGTIFPEILLLHPLVNWNSLQ